MKKKAVKKQKKRISKVYISFLVLLLAGVFVIGYSLWKGSQIQVPCANSISCVNDLSGRFDPEGKAAVYLGKSIAVPKESEEVAIGKDAKAVLGESSNKKIFVDLSAQRLYAKEGDVIVHEFPVSTGKWWKTPTGTFQIWIKLRYTRMSGGSKANGTYYNLPNVPYTMYFYNDAVPKYKGYGIHGAYWHNNFGIPMSHGCVNMDPEDAGVLYAWANPHLDSPSGYATEDNPGTEIVIYGDTPAVN